ncbi:hypothetical protein M5X00_20610 [Paenibacillus alvei]|uniref:Uncharacterized protein n=1 Tax=Paenibacillus alvei TaxID=44250 RepID=A0ABT4H809_PAEAL|nr:MULTISPECIES: hypothetical protein [Paenibacillus]MCY9736147.1 hypothetical protein [Paenibacillus alvei]MCY9756644.1 hypothetical protein [Paenibacillus alvei]MCY9764754.1 hypothetical protein [Paenibacillus alvei]MCY9771117.1 hypothetical protein [Paenibacillus alvei]GIO81395.1 hypothetical protein J6TS7_50050 [Paenibacillus dendritiformis]
MTAIWFAFSVFLFAICAGVVISVLIFVPLFIYVIPYTLWVGSENEMGRHKDKKKEGVWRSARNATILYKSWIRREKPSF